TVAAAEVKNLQGYSVFSNNNVPMLVVPKTAGSFSVDSVDLTGIAALELVAGGDKAPRSGYAFSLHLNSVNGPKIGEGVLPGGLKTKPTAQGYFLTTVDLPVKPVTDGRFKNLYIVSKPLAPNQEGTLVVQAVRFKPAK
ncbi:MAG: hypothetical protein M3Q06_14175, partial [Bacteroidota bacterium]|nr:hypothetical protein [Bacteroidota bacterium]